MSFSLIVNLLPGIERSLFRKNSWMIKWLYAASKKLNEIVRFFYSTDHYFYRPSVFCEVNGKRLR